MIPTSGIETVHRIDQIGALAAQVSGVSDRVAGR